jgi:serine/threonine-protein kinase
MPPAVGESGRYQLHGELARGGMGVVLKGRDVDLGRDVAVKVLLERHRDNPLLIRRFVEEAQIAGQLQHPGIIPVYELGRLPDDRLYIAMKLVRGRTLADLLHDRNDVSDDRPRFIAIFEQVAQAVAYAHACGVVHRDLKPSNIMVGSFGEVQLMDWGLAKVIDRGGVADEARALLGQAEAADPIRTLRTGSVADESQAGSVLGTPSYMAPEQARGRLDTLDERADVFGLGAILCEILTGLPPYSGPSGDEVCLKAARADLSEALLRLDAAHAEPELTALTKSCLMPAPRDRPRDAGAVVATLSAHLKNVQQRLAEAELARARAEARAAAERRRRSLVASLAASLLALATLVGSGSLWWSRHRSALESAAARDVKSTLHEASLLLGRARAENDADTTAWAELTQALKRAEALLPRPEVGPDLRRELRDFLAMASRERAQAEIRLKDARMLQRLATIHSNIALDLDFHRADREHAAAFRDYGIDVDSLPPETAGARIAASPIAARLVDALDQWTFVRQVNKSDNRRHLAATARIADPDPWRCRLRDALELATTDRIAAQTAFCELANSATDANLHRESISRLAYALMESGDKDQAASLLQRAQQAHPDDFWINYDLGRSLLGAGRSDEAARYFSAAVALRPGSEIAHKGLREALRTLTPGPPRIQNKHP